LHEQKEKVTEWVRTNFGPIWSHEVSEAFRHSTPSVTLALKGDDIIGFAAHGALELERFGPIGVIESERNKGIGSILLFKSLISMKEDGRRNAIIPFDSNFFFFSQIPSVRGVRCFWTLYKKL
jgi:hypothetical protein